MEPLTIETFNPDMMKAINSEQKRAGEINYTLVKFSYDGGKILLLGSMKNSDYSDLRVPREIFIRYPQDAMRRTKDSLKDCAK